MAFNNGAISREVLKEVIHGLKSRPTPLAREFCTIKRGRNGLVGKVPYLTSASTLGSTGNGRAGQAPGSDIPTQQASLAYADYDCLQYPGRVDIAHASIINLNSLDLDALAEFLVACMAQSAALTDTDLAQILADANANNTFDCNSAGGGEWDTADGTALTDLDKIRTSGAYAKGANTVIFGVGAWSAFRGCPEVIGRVAMSNSTLLTDSEARSLLSGFGFTNIYLFDNMVNAADDGLAISVSDVFSSGVWVGHKSDLLMIDPDHELNGDANAEKVIGAPRSVLSYVEYADFVRPHKEMGCRMTNVLSS